MKLEGRSLFTIPIVATKSIERVNHCSFWDDGLGGFRDIYTFAFSLTEIQTKIV